MARLNHLAYAQGPHDLTNLDRRDIALAILDPTPHRRLKGEVEITNQKLPVFKLRYLGFVIRKVRFLDHALRAAGQMPLPIDMLAHE